MLLPKQYDILSLIVLTAAIAIACAVSRVPIRPELKVHAVTVVLVCLCLWMLHYYKHSAEQIRTFYVLSGCLVAVSLGILQFFMSPIMNIKVGMLFLPAVVLPACMLGWHVYKVIFHPVRESKVISYSRILDARLAELFLSLGLLQLSTLIVSAIGCWALVGAPLPGLAALIVIQLSCLYFYRRVVHYQRSARVEAGAGLVITVPLVAFSAWVYLNTRSHLQDTDLFFGIAMLMLGLFATGCILVIIRGDRAGRDSDRLKRGHSEFPQPASK